MKTLYVAQFQVRNDENDTTYNLVVQSIKELVKKWFKDHYDIEIDLFKENLEVSLKNNEITIKAKRTTDNLLAAFWELTWKRVETEKSKILNIGVSKHLQEIEVQISVGVQADVLENLSAFPPPNLTAKLIETFDCYLNNQKLTLSPQFIQKDDVDSFYSNVLISNNRILPAVVISPTSLLDKKYVVEPECVASDLVGIAEVFVLENQDAARELIDKIGSRDLACYNGVVRVYRPHFSQKAMPREHPYYRLPRTKNIRETVVEECASLSVIRFEIGEVTRSAESAINTEQREKLYEAIKSSKDKESIDKIATELIDQVTQLEKENKDLTNQNISLQNQNIFLQKNLKEIQQYQPKIYENDELPIEITSVFQAIETAKTQFHETLVFDKKADDSAKKSDYEKPNRVYDAFVAMDKICKKRREAIKEGESVGGRIQELFEDEGFRYSPKISEKTTAKWREEYTITYKGTQMLIEEHIELGNDRDSKYCLRIHFVWHKADQKFIIGHVGKHKPNTLT
jgi:hypothetical protein